MQSSLDVYCHSEYGDYVVPDAFSMPDSSLFLDENGKALRVDIDEWLRYELNGVEDWITKMPGTSDFTRTDCNLLFQSSSLLLVFLKVAARSAHLQGHVQSAEGVYLKL